MYNFYISVIVILPLLEWQTQFCIFSTATLSVQFEALSMEPGNGTL